VSLPIPATMQAAFLERPGSLALRTVAVPVPAAGELLVKVEAALTCGTDLKLFQRGHARIPTPTPFGHEFAGTVAAAGAGTQFDVGAAICCVPTAPCGACDRCTRGRENLCELAVGRMLHGAYAEFVLVPAHIARTHVFQRSAALDAKVAAVLEPLACVVHGASRIDWCVVRTVAVLGDGPIGLLFARLAVLHGADTVVIGHHENRLAVARAFGARTEPVHDARYDAVIECAGTPETWRLASGLAATGGRVLLFGGCAAGTRVDFDAYRIHYEEVDHIGAFHYTPTAVLEAKRMLENGDVAAHLLITHELPLERLHDALELVASRAAIKVAVLP
jgi:L-iditol 2-dehydrogenase